MMSYPEVAKTGKSPKPCVQYHNHNGRTSNDLRYNHFFRKPPYLYAILVVGLEHFLLFHILGIIIPVHYFFSRGVAQPPTRMHRSHVFKNRVSGGFPGCDFSSRNLAIVTGKAGLLGLLGGQMLHDDTTCNLHGVDTHTYV